MLPQQINVVKLENMKKLLILMVAVMATSVVYAQAAGAVKLGWDQYQNTNDVSVTAIRIYGVRGTNTVFLTNNSNATLLGSTAVTNTTLTVSNLVSGAWTFAATAYAGGTNNLESVNSNTVWTNVVPGVVTNLRFP